MKKMSSSLRHTNVLGVKISALTYAQALDGIAQRLHQKKGGYICVVPVHSVMECQKDTALLAGVNAALYATPDGMPMVWLSKLYGQTETERVYGTTLTLKVAELAAQKKWKIFLVSGGTGQAQNLKKYLEKRFQRLQIVGAENVLVRPITEKQNTEIIKKIHHTRADIVFVGLGCPFQEWWMIRNTTQLPQQILIGVGAAFNLLTGAVPQAPVWMQNAGLEWLFRLIQEPRRLFFRYTVTNSQFILLISQQLLKDFVLKKLVR